MNECPHANGGQRTEQEDARWFEWLLYSWVSPMLRRGTTRRLRGERLSADDLIRVPHFEDPTINARMLQRAWQRELEEHPSTPSLTRALARTFWRRVSLGGVFLFLSDACLFAAPFVLRELIKWMDSETQPIFLGFVYVLLLTLCNWGMSICLNTSMHHSMTGFSQMTCALQVVVFDKAMELRAKHDATGFVTTLHMTDTAQFNEAARFFHGLWVSPLLLVAATVALYFFMGLAGVLAMALLVVFIPAQTILMSKMAVFRKFVVDCTDKRMTAVNEALQSMRVCKFMSWEERFAERISVQRMAEVKMLSVVYSLKAVVTTIMQSMPVVVTFALFALAVALGGELRVEDVFPALSMLTLVRVPAMFIPMSVSRIVRINISINRITRFLLLPSHEKRLLPIPEQTQSGLAVRIKDLQVLTDDNHTPLISCGKFADITIPQGKLTVIVGGTGSGKSSLIAAILGEAVVSDQTVIQVGGSIAYVPQEPWIINETVRSNIVLNQPHDEERYNAVLAACQLQADLNQLPDGDMTEIGERGINLSGGQKQRIAFARAVYSDRDIIVMDDVLSALDAHVGRAIFEECIVGPLLGTKTRILVTHHLQYLPHAQVVIKMDNTKVSFVGPMAGCEEPRSPIVSNQRHPHAAISVTSASSPSSPLITASPTALQPPTAAARSGGASLMSKEEMIFGDVSLAVYAWYMRLGRLQWVGTGFAMFTVWRASTILTDMWLAIWSSEQNAFGRSYTTNEYLMFFGIFTAIAIVLTYFRQQIYAAFMLNVAENAHEALVRRVIHAPMWFFDVTPTGRLLNRFSRDMDGMDHKLSEVVQTCLILSFNILGTLFLVAFAGPYFLVMIPFLVIIFRSMFSYYSDTARGVKRLEGVERTPMMAIMSESIGGLSTIRAFDLVPHFRGIHSERALRALRPVYAQRCCQRWLSARTEMLGAVIVFGAAYLAAMNRALGDSSWNVSVDTSVAALALSYAMSTTSAITNMTRQMAELECEMSCAERIHEYSTLIPQERDVTYGAAGHHSERGRDGEVSAPTHIIDAPPPSWPPDGEVVFDNVDVRYRDGLPLVLRGVSFRIPARSKVGVVGRTGSGKSTLLLALFRMVDACGGRIAIDGRDISTVTLRDLRTNATVIPQDPVLFRGTIRSNIDPFNAYADGQLWDAIEKVGIAERLRGSDSGGSDASGGGLDEPVHERGSNFSVGQRQLLCLARAMLKRCKILLLDEASASVSFESDAQIQRVIRTEFRECTVITIAHRLQSIMDSDLIVAMADGTVAEVGAPAELLRNSDGHFHSMVAAHGADELERMRTISTSGANAF